MIMLGIIYRPGRLKLCKRIWLVCTFHGLRIHLLKKQLQVTSDQA